MPKIELVSLNKEAAIKLTMDQDIIKEYTSSWNIINIEYQTCEDDDSYVFINTDRKSVSKTKSTGSIVVT